MPSITFGLVHATMTATQANTGRRCTGRVYKPPAMLPLLRTEVCRHRRWPVGPPDLRDCADEGQPVVERYVAIGRASRRAGLWCRSGRATAPVVVAHHLLHGRHEQLRAHPKVLE